MRLRVSPATALLWAVLLFMDEDGFMASALPAIAVHELGHIAAIRLCGGCIDAIDAEVFGLKIGYSGIYSRAASVFCHLAGPITGAIYGGVCLACGWQPSGMLSLMLTVFNLLPIAPLDGGKALAEINEEAAARCSMAVSLLLVVFSAYILFRWCVLLPLCVSISLFSGALPAFRLRRQ